ARRFDGRCRPLHRRLWCRTFPGVRTGPAPGRHLRTAQDHCAVDVLGGDHNDAALTGAELAGDPFAAALTGLAGELYRPASSALLADLVPAGQRITAFSAYRMAFNAGWAFGPATAGFLAERGYFWLFVGDTVTSVLFGLVAFFALPRGVRSQQVESKWMESLRVLRRDRKFHQVLAASFAIALVFFEMSWTYGGFVVQLWFLGVSGGAVVLWIG